MMRQAGIQGLYRRRRRGRTVRDRATEPSSDVVGRNVTVDAPNRLWVQVPKCPVILTDHGRRALTREKGAPPGTRTPNPLIERHLLHLVPPLSPVLVRGGPLVTRSCPVGRHVLWYRFISGEQNGRLIMLDVPPPPL